jgi:hypothetical protein
MALVLKFQACVQAACTELLIKELTGLYKTTTNPGGYGTPNPDPEEAESAILVITSPSDQEYTINLFDNGFPTSDTTFEYIIPMSELGNRTEIEDGQWIFVYTVVIDNVEYKVTKSYIFTCNSECCVSQLKAELPSEDCNCDDVTVKQMDYFKAWGFLEALKYAAFCGNITEYDKILNILNKLCSKTSCKTCN